MKAPAEEKSSAGFAVKGQKTEDRKNFIIEA